jgi:hypothetical protein
MILAILVANFFAGLFLCNCVPHLVSGLMGRSFPTPFAKPRGVGLSSPLVNFLWGFANLVVGLLLLQNWPVGWMFGPSFLCFLLGALLIGVYLSVHFGRVVQAKP